MNFILLLIFSILSALLLALLEIQIEGKNGWAKNLPTWKISLPILFPQNRPLTGYHLYLFSLLFLLSHFGIVFGWSFRNEIYLIIFFIIFTTLEDFLWFIINPNFGYKKFNQLNISWYQTWFCGLPVHYWLAIFISSALIILASTM